MAEGKAEYWAPGQVWADPEVREALEDRPTVRIEVSNTGDRPVQVGSHFHFFESNRGLSFDRKASYGMRLAIPAGTAVRFEPGQTQEVELIAIGGERVVFGLGGLTSGKLDDLAVREAAFERAKNRDYRGA